MTARATNSPPRAASAGTGEFDPAIQSYWLCDNVQLAAMKSAGELRAVESHLLACAFCDPDAALTAMHAAGLTDLRQLAFPDHRLLLQAIIAWHEAADEATYAADPLTRLRLFVRDLSAARPDLLTALGGDAHLDPADAIRAILLTRSSVVGIDRYARLIVAAYRRRERLVRWNRRLPGRITAPTAPRRIQAMRSRPDARPRVPQRDCDGAGRAAAVFVAWPARKGGAR